MRHQMCQLGVYHWPHVVSCSALLDLSREYCCSVTQNVIHFITHVRKIWLWYIVYIGAIAFINEERTSNKKRAHFTQTFWSIRVLWSYVYDGYCSNLILKVRVNQTQYQNSHVMCALFSYLVEQRFYTDAVSLLLLYFPYCRSTIR